MGQIVTYNQNTKNEQMFGRTHYEGDKKMKDELIALITELLTNTDMDLLDLIYKILVDSLQL